MLPPNEGWPLCWECYGWPTAWMWWPITKIDGAIFSPRKFTFGYRQVRASLQKVSLCLVFVVAACKLDKATLLHPQVIFTIYRRNVVLEKPTATPTVLCLREIKFWPQLHIPIWCILCPSQAVAFMNYCLRLKPYYYLSQCFQNSIIHLIIQKYMVNEPYCVKGLVHRSSYGWCVTLKRAPLCIKLTWKDSRSSLIVVQSKYLTGMDVVEPTFNQ